MGWRWSALSEPKVTYSTCTGYDRNRPACIYLFRVYMYVSSHLASAALWPAQLWRRYNPCVAPNYIQAYASGVELRPNGASKVRVAPLVI